MIQIVSGKLGAGKTLYSVGLAFDALVDGRTVVTNIRMFYDGLAQLALKSKRIVLEPEQLVFVDPEEHRNWQEVIPMGSQDAFVECFFDEVHLFYNARDWAKTQKENGSLMSYLSQSRKAAVNITLIVQDVDTLDKQFRLQAEWILFIASSDHLPTGPLGKFPISFFIVSKISSKTKQRINKTFKRYNRKLFDCYDSFSFLDSKMKKLAETSERVQRRKLEKVSHFFLLKLSLKNFFQRFKRQRA